MTAFRSAIAAIALAAIQLGGCGDYARPARPAFRNYYGPHSDGRSPIRRWWLFAPQTDYEGESFRMDYELNLLLVYIGDDPDVWLNYADDRVFDERNYVLLYVSKLTPDDGPISVPNTPDIRAARNRLFAFNRAGEWHDFAIPEGFAKDFEKDFLSPCPNPPKKILVELERFAKQRGLDELSEWVATQR